MSTKKAKAAPKKEEGAKKRAKPEKSAAKEKEVATDSNDDEITPASAKRSKLDSFAHTPSSTQTSDPNSTRTTPVSPMKREINKRTPSKSGKSSESSKKRRRKRIIASDDDFIVDDDEDEQSSSEQMSVDVSGRESNEISIISDNGDVKETAKTTASKPATKESIESVEGGVKYKSDAKTHAKFVKMFSKLHDNEDVKDEKRENLLGDDALEEFEKKKKTAKNSRGGRSGSKYTPGEQQYLELRKKHPGVLLVVETGYKYTFYGRDAEVAHKVLRIVAFPKKNFLQACVPQSTLYKHIRRLVQAGYKVGLVEQTETAALKKAGDNKSSLFERKLTALYTKSTFVGHADISSLEEQPSTGVGQTGSLLMCVHETTSQSSNANVVRIGVLGVNLATGEVLYDEFADDMLRTELDTRFTHLQPAEMILARGEDAISAPTRRALDAMCGTKTKTEEESKAVLAERSSKEKMVRVELVDDEWFEEVHAWEAIEKLFVKENNDDDDVRHTKTLDELRTLPAACVQCFGAVARYLQDFQHLSNSLRLFANFQRFRGRACMLLNGEATKHLEVFTNGTTGEEDGSLFAHMNHTCTAFGKRQLRRWLSTPLLDAGAIRARHDAIELLAPSTDRRSAVEALMKLLSRMPDLERGLTRIYYKTCTPMELIRMLSAFKQISDTLPDRAAIERDFGKQSLVYQALVDDIPDNFAAWIGDFLDKLNVGITKDGKLSDVLAKESFVWYGELEKCHVAIAACEELLHGELLRNARKESKIATLQYRSLHQGSSLLEFLMEVPKKTKVPPQWTLVNSTTKVCRYRSPDVSDALQELECERERLALAAKSAWSDFLGRVSAHYATLRRLVRAMATMDCLMSLAELARTEGYVRPEVLDNGSESEGALLSFVSVKEGRHPVVEVLLNAQGQSYVPNDMQLGDGVPRIMVVTGPNMGGKSSYTRTVALLVLMAQCGSFVPAKSMRLVPFDAIFTRMGSGDSLMSGQSTFMVELMETSTALSQATGNSLIILDELGRGTSTHDGTAIAYATLQYVSEVIHATCLFITHFVDLEDVARQLPNVVNYHMGFVDQSNNNEKQQICFTYKAEKGSGSGSYGLNVARLADISDMVLSHASKKWAMSCKPSLNVARLAGISDTVLLRASKMSDELQAIVARRREERVASKFETLLENGVDAQDEEKMLFGQIDGGFGQELTRKD